MNRGGRNTPLVRLLVAGLMTLSGSALGAPPGPAQASETAPDATLPAVVAPDAAQPAAADEPGHSAEAPRVPLDIERLPLDPETPETRPAELDEPEEPGWDDAPMAPEPGPHADHESSEPGWSQAVPSESRAALNDNVPPSVTRRLDPSGPLEIHGFAEGAYGTRVVADGAQANDLVLAEARARIAFEHERSWAAGSLKMDLVADDIDSEVRPELREAHIRAQPVDFWELSAGRRVLTWGTGDLVFLNDMFPKDFVSFFVGRADEFLKVPVDHVKTSLFSRHLNADVVIMPRFQPDRVPTGERLSYYSPSAGAVVGQTDQASPDLPAATLKNSELAARIYGRLGRTEWAAYFYLGHTKQPSAIDAASGSATFARRAVYGLSLRFPLLGGIANLEEAYYDSIDNRERSNPLYPSGEMRGLVGYEREVASRITLGTQYYVEHHPLAQDVPAAGPAADRHWLTLRLNALLAQDDLTLSVFGVCSANERDGYVRLSASYRVTDEASATLGSNLMLGAREDTFFGQLARNSNVYARLRYAF